MPTRIDSPSTPQAYSPQRDAAPSPPAPALRQPPARSAAVAHAVRSGGSNLQRFFASMNCVASTPPDLDLETDEGRANYELALRDWAARAPRGSQESSRRKHAVVRIGAWLAEGRPDMTLNLSNLQLKSLPPLPSNLRSLDIRGAFNAHGQKKYPKVWPAGLRDLNMSGNNLKQLPDNLPDSLIELRATRCQLKRLPSKLPAQLESLFVSDNALKDLIALPPRLKVLDARRNKLTDISARFPDELHTLMLSNNPLGPLQRLPEQLRSLELNHVLLRRLPPLPPQLVRLEVSNNHLERLDRPLPLSLQELRADDNPLVELPPSLPPAMETLTIRRTDVQELPAILPASLDYLDISYTDISEMTHGLSEAMQRWNNALMLVSDGITLDRTALEPDGPSTSEAGTGAVNRYGVGMREESLAAAVGAWYGAPDAKRDAVWERIYQEGQDGLANATVPLWKVLDSLKVTADYPNPSGDGDEEDAARSEMRAAFTQRVTVLLGAMENDKALRETCCALAHDRVESCHDNVALGFDDMEQAHLAARAVQGDVSRDDLFAMGLDRLKLLMLDELAIPKANADWQAAVSEGDPLAVLESVEVVLAYRLALAERLDLPVKTKNMLYSLSANVTPEHLSEVEGEVRRALDDPEQVAGFMVDWRPWQVELERRHPQVFDRAALGEAKAGLERDMEHLMGAYDDFCADEAAGGELGEGALKTLEQINVLKSKFDTLEDKMFGPPRQRLTEAYMAERAVAAASIDPS